MMNINVVKDVIYLLSCAVNNISPVKKRVDMMDINAVLDFASHHLVSAAVAMVLEKGGIFDNRILESILASQRKTIVFDNYFNNIKQQLEYKEIWYMPLKGSVIKDMYPEYGMREFADYDILFDKSKSSDVRDIMEDLGFSTKYYGCGNHDVYHKKPMLNFEMHTRLFGEKNIRFYKYYQNIEEKLVGEGCEKQFTPEDFYIYFLAHEYKHYSGAGTGLRSLMDTYILLSSSKMDMGYIAKETEKLGIREFEERNRSLSLNLLGRKKLTLKDKEMLRYMVCSGVHGNILNSVQNSIDKNKYSKLQYMLNRFFVPISKKNKDYIAFKSYYPFFYKHKILLPLLTLYRVARSTKNGKLRAELRAVKSAKSKR